MNEIRARFHYRVRGKHTGLRNRNDKKTGSDEHLRASVRRRKLFLLRSADRSADLRFAAFEVGLAAAAFLNLVKLLSHFNS